MDISLLFPIIILLLFIPIFLSSRKQKRAQAEMASLQSSLEPGDVVSTTSGLRGTIVDASYEDTIDLEIADGVVTTWVRAAIRERITTADEPAAPDAPAPAVIDAPATPAESPSLEKSPGLTNSGLTNSGLTNSGLHDSALPDSDLDKVALEKDDSTNGSPRS
jgi:preprotein translocase subunit YajC